MSKRTFAAALAAIAVCGLTVATAGARSTGSINGAGSSFAAPLFALWQKSYSASTINYNPIGSGGGIQAITNKQVDFGASDAPLTKDQFGACPCVQIPVLMSATSVPYNVPGVGYGLNITGPVLADIYLGKVQYWDNAKIKKLNPKQKLPHLKITPVFRSDGSGTTYNFTDYLSTVSKAFKNKVGNSTQVSFPVGVGARGSSGVAAALKRTDGSVGYVDVAYSLKNKFKIFKVQNRAKKFTLPGIRSIKAAASLVKKVPANNELHIVDPAARGKAAAAYPICTFTWVIVQKATGKADELKPFIRWAVTKGQTVQGALKLLYIPIPQVVRQAALKTLPKIH